MLLVHGWGACSYSYDAMLPALADAGFRVLAMDLPGLGLSDKPHSRDAYSTTAMVQAVRDIAAQLGLDRFALVGHSMGGAIALRLALDAESRIDKLVVLNAVGLGRVPLMGPVRVLTPAILEPVIGLAVRRITIRMILHLAYGTAGRPTTRDVEQYWVPPTLPGMLRACRLLAHHFDFKSLPDATLRSIRVPVLAIASSRDRMVLGCSERARLIPNGRVIAVDEGGHLALQECAPRVNAAVLDFLGT